MTYILRTESVRRANQNMMKGRSTNTSNLPVTVRASIARRRYSGQEINSAYGRVINATHTDNVTEKA